MEEAYKIIIMIMKLVGNNNIIFGGKLVLSDTKTLRFYKDHYYPGHYYCYYQYKYYYSY